MKRVRVKLAWQTYSVGDEFTPNGTLRDWLVSNGYVDVIEDNQAPVNRQQKVSNKKQTGGLFAR